VPSGDLSELLDRAADALLEKIAKKRFGKTCAPRKARSSWGKRTLPNEVRREAVARDGLRCSFVADDGRRCEETGFLEFDHVVPVALGGQASDGVRILCRAHNQFEAERILGREAVEKGKAAKAMDEDLVAGLRRMGVTASDARQAVSESRAPGQVEERMRAALRALAAIYARRGRETRCREPVALYVSEGHSRSAAIPTRQRSLRRSSCTATLARRRGVVWVDGTPAPGLVVTVGDSETTFLELDATPSPRFHGRVRALSHRHRAGRAEPHPGLGAIAPLAEAHSDARGFFQMAPRPGRYWLELGLSGAWRSPAGASRWRS